MKRVEDLIQYIEEKIDPYSLNNTGKANVRKLVRQFDIEVLFDAVDISFDNYIEYDEDGAITKDSVENFVNKIGGIAYNKSASPKDAAQNHVIATGKFCFSYWNNQTARDLLDRYTRELRDADYDDDQIAIDLETEVLPLLKRSANWSQWRATMEAWIEEIKSWKAEKDIAIVQNEAILPNSLFNGSPSYLLKLAAQINASYERNLYDCCAVMMRRLMEILIVLSYKNNQIEEEIMNPEATGHVSLDKMIKRACENSVLSLSANTKKSMQTVKELGNFAAHKIWFNTTKKDIEPHIISYRAIIEELLYKAKIIG